MSVADGEKAGQATAPKGILWIASYPKSGNTWTRIFLNNLLKIMQDEDEGAPQSINRISEYTVWDIGAKPYARHLGKAVTEADRAEIALVRPAVQAEIADGTEGLAMVKTHHALVSDRGVPTINFAVTSGAIYIVRNPLDVAISYAHHLGVDIDYAIEEMALRNKETGVTAKSVYEIYGSWSQHVESWTRKPHDAVHVMRYEDMLADPVAAFGALAHHLLLSPSPEQLAVAIERSSFATLKQQEGVAGFSEKPDSAERFFREGRADQWRDRLSPSQVRAIVAAHHHQMRRFGYLTDELAPLID